jgi:hypothetical protein
VVLVLPEQPAGEAPGKQAPTLLLCAYVCVWCRSYCLACRSAAISPDTADFSHALEIAGIAPARAIYIAVYINVYFDGCGSPRPHIAQRVNNRRRRRSGIVDLHCSMASAFSYQRRLSPHVPPLIRLQHWFNPPHFFCGSLTAAGVFFPTLSYAFGAWPRRASSGKESARTRQVLPGDRW